MRRDCSGSPSDELIAALGEVAEDAVEYAARYATFREVYCDLENGRASERVVDAMLRTDVASQPTERAATGTCHAEVLAGRSAP